MTLPELLQLLLSSGIFSGGLGVLKWALSIEKRVTKLELHHGKKNAAA